MKKIVFVTIPMQAMKSEQVYKVDGNDNIENKKAVFIPINGILAGLLKKSDDVKIVRIITESATCFSEKNAEKQKEELDGFNKTIGANISYIDIRAPYEETSATLELRFRELIGALEDNAEIILDMTFGPKTLTPVFFYVLGFAEKFFNADIKNIFYNKVDFDADHNPVPGTAVIYDMTSLYYLNSLTSVMSAPDSKTALERLDKFFNL